MRSHVLPERTEVGGLMKIEFDRGNVGVALHLTAEDAYEGWLLGELEADKVGVCTVSKDKKTVESLIILRLNHDG